MNNIAYVVAMLQGGRVVSIQTMSEWPGTIMKGSPTQALISTAHGRDFAQACRRAIRKCVVLHPWTLPFLRRELAQMSRSRTVIQAQLRR